MKRPWDKISARFFRQNIFILMLFLSIFLSTSNVQGVESSLLQLEWRYGTYGTGIGGSGINIYDIDGNGVKEMVMGGSTYYSGGASTFWYVVQHTGSDVYDQVWVSDMYPADIAQIVVSDIDSDGVGEIYVSLSNGTVIVYDGLTLLETGSFNAGDAISSMAIADANGDGNKEIVISDDSKVYVYSAETFALEWETTAYGVSNLAIGNVDTDPAPEIITTTSDGHGYVIDGVSHAPEWDYINGFGNLIELGDIDGEGMNEIISSAAWQKITCFDADIKSPKWEITTDQDIGALAVTDTDGDGIPEILYGDGQWGEIRCYDAATLAEKWHIDNPAHGVTDIALGDVNTDGVLEVIWGAGATSSGSDYLYVADTVTHQIEWQSVNVDGPLSAVDVGDIDDDGINEILMVSFESESGYDSGVIHIFDAVTHELEWQHTLDNMDWMGVRSVKIGDIDDDGETEFVVTTGDVYDGIIQVYNGHTYTLERQSAGYNGNYFTALAIGDVDNDGKTEIVAGQGVEHTGADGTHLIVFDGSSLEEKWKSISLGSNSWGEIYDIKLADVDNDGHIEIIASVEGEQIYVFDGVTHQLKWLAAVPAYALEVSDINFDGQKEILIGRDDGVVAAYDGIAFSLVDSFNFGSGQPIYWLKIDDINNGGRNEWIVSEAPEHFGSDPWKMSVFDGTTKTLLWQKDNVGAIGRNFNHIISFDLDNDQQKEIIFGSSYALHQFEVSSTDNIIAVAKSGKGTGSIRSTPSGINCGADCAKEYGEDTVVTLTATADSGSFAKWTGDCSDCGTNPDCSVAMDADKSCTALFDPNYYILTVTETNTGSGIVTSTPAGIACGPDCSETYPRAGKVRNVKLNAKPDAYSTFLGWGGDCQARGTKQTCTIKMDSDRNVTASFGLPDISVSPNSYEFGNVAVRQSSSPATFTIHNNGTGDLKITKIKIVGTDAKMFRIKGGGKKTIAPGGTFQFTVTFKPTSAGNKSATIQIPSNDPDTPTLDVPLSGSGNI